MSARPVRIGRSATGLGLFATKPIESGAYIVTYRGKRIPTAEAQERERRFGAKYMFEINRHWTIDGSSRRNLGRYINHSCDANAEARLRKGQMVFVALRRIGPGEEITLDYGEEYFDLYLKASGCRCAACRAKQQAKDRAKDRTKNRTKAAAGRRLSQGQQHTGSLRRRPPVGPHKTRSNFRQRRGGTLRLRR